MKSETSYNRLYSLPFPLQPRWNLLWKPNQSALDGVLFQRSGETLLEIVAKEDSQRESNRAKATQAYLPNGSDIFANALSHKPYFLILDS